MTLAGYPPHARSGSRVVGISHMSTFAAMRFFEDVGITSGWLLAEGSQPQLERISTGRATQVGVAELFSDRRVVKTEGLASGTVVFAASNRGAGAPPSDRPLTTWAESQAQPWLELVDNEVAYWGGLDDEKINRLLLWFICQRPFELDCRKLTIEPRTLALLRHGLMEHGWTRNLALVKPERGMCELWGGVHRNSLLDSRHHPRPGAAQSGLRLRIEFQEVFSRDVLERCPLDDDTGKLALR